MTGVHADDGDDEDDGDVGAAGKDGLVLSNIHILPIMPQLAMSEPVHC